MTTTEQGEQNGVFVTSQEKLTQDVYRALMHGLKNKKGISKETRK